MNDWDKKIMRFETNLSEEQMNKILKKVKLQKYRDRSYFLYTNEKFYILEVEDRVKLKWKCKVRDNEIIIKSQMSLEFLYRGMVFGVGFLIWLVASISGILIISKTLLFGRIEISHIIVETFCVLLLVMNTKMLRKTSHKYYEPEISLFFQDRIFK